MSRVVPGALVKMIESEKTKLCCASLSFGAYVQRRIVRRKNPSTFGDAEQADEPTQEEAFRTIRGKQKKKKGCRFSE